MSGSHGAERPSRSPRCASYEDGGASLFLSCTVTSSHNTFAPRVPSFSMPSPERNRYSNKESAKVNAGLHFGKTESDGGTACDVSGAFNTNIPAVDIDFSKLFIPIVAPEAAPRVETLVRRLLRPPPHAFVHGMLSTQWVIGLVGQRHVDFRSTDERYVLATHSQLRTRGSALGLPALYMEWLCGDHDESSATEQGIYLTPEYFQELADEEDN